MSTTTIVKATDMSQELQDKIINLIEPLIVPLTKGGSLERDVSHEIKIKLDQEFEPTWHVIVGKNFGSFVTHEQGHFLYCYHGPWAVLLFKTA
ncbi:dynein light chain 1, cytoplasmic [Monosporozyma unispora]|nr:Dynein light chain [Kazachstania unispora]